MIPPLPLELNRIMMITIVITITIIMINFIQISIIYFSILYRATPNKLLFLRGLSNVLFVRIHYVIIMFLVEK